MHDDTTPHFTFIHTRIFLFFSDSIVNLPCVLLSSPSRPVADPLVPPDPSLLQPLQPPIRGLTQQSPTY